MPLCYEDKLLTQHWTMHNWCIHWPVSCLPQKDTDVPKVDILNT